MHCSDDTRLMRIVFDELAEFGNMLVKSPAGRKIILPPTLVKQSIAIDYFTFIAV